MYHYSYNDLQNLGNEIIYPDQYTGDIRSGIVLKVEHIAPRTAMVYVMSPYDEENDKLEEGFRFKDIMVFDDRPNEENGWYKNGIEPFLK